MSTQDSVPHGTMSRELAHRFSKVAERHGMPVSVDQLDDNHPWYSVTGRLDGSYRALCSHRRLWRAKWTSRLERATYCAMALVVPLSLITIFKTDPFPLWVSLLQLAGALASLTCSAASLTLISWVRITNDDPEKYLDRVRPDLLPAAKEIGAIWERERPGETILGLRAVAGLVAAGGEQAVPAHWFHLGSDPSEPYRGAEVLRHHLELDAWFAKQSLTPAQEDICRVIGPEYTGSIGELVEAARLLA